MLLYETTIDPALRRVYALIDYAANEATVEICDIALDAYNDIWGRSACEKPACLRSYELQSVAMHQIDMLRDGILRNKTPWRLTDFGQKYRGEVVELPLDGQFMALRRDGRYDDGGVEVLAYFDTLTAAAAFVDRYPACTAPSVNIQEAICYS